MNNHILFIEKFDIIYKFLTIKYFFKVKFGLIYLFNKKIRIYNDWIIILGSKKNKKNLKPSVKYSQQV